MRNKKAFTLIEVMVVMAIIAVLAILIIGAIQLARRTATETTHRSNAKTIQTGMEGYYAKNKVYPVMTNATFNAAATTLSVTIATSNGCPTSATVGGGGQVTSTASTYTIIPYNYNCSAALGASDELTVN